MTAANLAIVVGPLLLKRKIGSDRDAIRDAPMIIALTEFLILHPDSIFGANPSRILPQELRPAVGGKSPQEYHRQNQTSEFDSKAPDVPEFDVAGAREVARETKSHLRTRKDAFISLKVKVRQQQETIESLRQQVARLQRELAEMRRGGGGGGGSLGPVYV